MEIPGGSATWIESSLLSDEDQQPPPRQQQQQHHPHALYATDLPPLNQDAFVGQPFHQNMVPNFDDAASTGLQEFPELQGQHFSQANAEQQGLRSGVSTNEAGDLASARRVHKADREKLRRDKLNEQFTELASALDPDRPKNDKATILSDSVLELNELRAEVKRLKLEHAALLDESRDLTQEKSELREEKALLKTETEQLNTQLQHRLRLALSWSMDPSLMLGAAAFPYPVPVPAAPTATPMIPPLQPQPAAPPASDSSPPALQDQQQQSSTQQSAQIPQPIPFLPPSLHLPPPYGIHPYAMFANRPAGGYFPYFPPHSSTVERPFPLYPTPGIHPLRSYPGQDGPPFLPPTEAPFKPLVAQQAAVKPSREDCGEQPESQQQSDNSSPVEVEVSSEVKQEIQLQPLVTSLSPTIVDGASDSNCVV